MAGMAVAAVGAVDTAEAAAINTVTKLAGPVSGDLSSPLDLLFDPIAGAHDLMSVSAGSVTTSEGGGFRVSVIYVDDTTASLGDFTLSHFGTQLLSDIPDADFAPFAQGDVKGLRFSYISGSSFAGSYLGLNIPASTEVTFAAVPLPATLALLPLGALALGAAGRRRRRSGAMPDADDMRRT